MNVLSNIATQSESDTSSLFLSLGNALSIVTTVSPALIAPNINATYLALLSAMIAIRSLGFNPSNINDRATVSHILSSSLYVYTCPVCCSIIASPLFPWKKHPKLSILYSYMYSIINFHILESFSYNSIPSAKWSVGNITISE